MSSGITLDQAQSLLDGAIIAYQAALTSQEYSKGDRRLVRAELSALSADIVKWQKLIRSLSGGIRITGATPI